MHSKENVLTELLLRNVGHSWLISSKGSGHLKVFLKEVMILRVYDGHEFGCIVFEIVPLNPEVSALWPNLSIEVESTR